MIQPDYDKLLDLAAHFCSKRHGCWTSCTNCLNEYCFEHFIESEEQWNSGTWKNPSYELSGWCNATCSNCGFQIVVKGVDNFYKFPNYCEDCGSKNTI